MADGTRLSRHSVKTKSQPAYEIKGLNNQITVERKKSRIAMIKHVVVTPIRDEESFLPSLFQKHDSADCSTIDLGIS